MLNRLYSWYGKRVVHSVVAVIAVLIAIVLYFLVQANGEVSAPEIAEKSNVAVQSVKNIISVSSFEAIGTVQAVSEAQLQIEAGGRITSVNTEIGKTVSAGSVLATIENKAESAQLLQAQGAYEAALAGAQASEVGVESAATALSSAHTNGITAFQNTYITVDSIIRNDLDELFTFSNGQVIGLKLDASGKAPVINLEREKLEKVLIQWSEQKVSVNTDTVVLYLRGARTNTLRIVQFVDTINALIADQDVNASFTQADKDVLEATLRTSRVALNGALEQIEGALSVIDGATKGLEQAQIAGSSVVPSASSAQVKIALGSLRAAQANYEKTLVRTPISGVVNALYLKSGEYVSLGQSAAIIANNNGLEIQTGVSEEDREKIAVGDAVIIDKTSSGVVTAIGGAIDPTTGKVAVKVSVDTTSVLKNGSTVSLSFVKAETDAQTDIIVPLASIKMTGSGPVAFSVTQDQKLKALPLELGVISGDSVLVLKGLSLESAIVTDARGLKEGQEVTVTTK